MKQLLQIILLGFAVQLVMTVDEALVPNKFVCYWNSSSFSRSGPAKVNVDELKPALSLCTHLIYNSAGINSKNYEVTSLHSPTKADNSNKLYKDIVSLRKCFPTLKVYLSIGGGVDPDSNYQKYISIVETSVTRNKFITSIVKLATDFDFDGVDLAWQFPPVYSKKSENSLTSSLYQYASSWIKRAPFKDEKVPEHRKGFSKLVWDLKSQLKQLNKALTLTVLPHVNIAYFDPELLAPSLDAIHLMAFDKVTPDRNPELADYPAPIYPRDNVTAPCIDNDVSYWTKQKTPKEKIVIGIPTHARTWKLSNSYSILSNSGNPPVAANGPGDKGLVSSIPGFLSHAEVCNHLNDKSNSLIKKDVSLNDKRSFGSYAYRRYNYKTQEDGIWIGYESYTSAENKALYVKQNGLGGIAIWDLSNDDVHGTCDGNRFPISSAAKFKLA